MSFEAEKVSPIPLNLGRDIDSDLAFFAHARGRADDGGRLVDAALSKSNTAT